MAITGAPALAQTLSFVYEHLADSDFDLWVLPVLTLLWQTWLNSIWVKFPRLSYRVSPWQSLPFLFELEQTIHIEAACTPVPESVLRGSPITPVDQVRNYNAKGPTIKPNSCNGWKLKNVLTLSSLAQFKIGLLPWTEVLFLFSHPLATLHHTHIYTAGGSPWNICVFTWAPNYIPPSYQSFFPGF